MTEEEKQLVEDSDEGLNEAPASATVKLKSAAGFEYLFTMRSNKAHVLMFKIKSMEAKWISLGWTPLAQNNFQRKEAKPVEYVEGRVCPKDGAKLIKGSGKLLERCENNKYDFQQKKNIGTCDYVVWNQPNQNQGEY